MAVKQNPRTGQAAIMMTLSLVMMCGLLGLVVDFGWANWRKEACKTAAESAAESAALAAKSSGTYTVQALTNCPSSPVNSVPLQVGCMYARQNGFTDGASGRTVKMQAGTTGSPVAGVTPTYWTAYTVSEDIPTTFSAVLGFTKTSVSAQAVAGVMPGSGGGCIYALSDTGAGVAMVGSTSITSACGIYVDSSDSGAVDMKGSSSITTTGGAFTGVVGDTSNKGSSSISPAAKTGQAYKADPFLGNLPTAPAAGSCQPTAQFNGSGSHTIPAGTYCDQVSTTGSGTLTLTTGTYFLKAGLSYTGSGVINATGPVTIYVSGGAVNVTGSGSIILSAPTSGTYNGILFWQPYSNTSAVDMTGSTDQEYTGLVYFPAADVGYTGSATATAMTLVVNTLTLKGSNTISNPASTPYDPTYRAPSVSLLQ